MKERVLPRRCLARRAQRVRLNNPIKLSSRETHEYWEIPVLFEDAHLLVINKPASLPTVPDPATPEQPSLAELLHAGIAEHKPWATARRLSFLKHVYRLDSEQSGVFVLTQNKEALTRLGDLFGAEKPLLECLVLAQGIPADSSFEVNSPIGPHPVRPDVMRIDPQHGKRSRTIFNVVEVFKSCVLMRASPLTLRPHQIRVHLRHAGHPVVGDSLYGGRPLRLSQLKEEYRLKPNQQERPLISSARIHFEKLDLPHPVTGQVLSVNAALPKELAVALKYLRKFKR